MATLNGENISVKDRVFDVLKGEGTVTGLEFNQISTLFDDGTRIRYQNEGYYGGIKRLYWQDPVAVEPTKDANRWETMKEFMRSVDNYLPKL